MHNLVSNGHLAESPDNLKEIKYIDSFFATISHSGIPAFVSSLREIGDLSCMVPQDFLMDSPLITGTFSYDNFQRKVVSSQYSAESAYVACVPVKTTLCAT